MPYVTSSELAHGGTATCNHAHLGTRSINLVLKFHIAINVYALLKNQPNDFVSWYGMPNSIVRNKLLIRYKDTMFTLTSSSTHFDPIQEIRKWVLSLRDYCIMHGSDLINFQFLGKPEFCCNYHRNTAVIIYLFSVHRFYPHRKMCSCVQIALLLSQ